MPATKITCLALLAALALSPAAYSQQTPAATDTGAGGIAMSVDNTVPELYLAARNGNLYKVRSLIADGTDVNVRNHAGRTALMSAVFFQNKSIVRELLGEGADMNARDATGRTAVMMAVAAGNIEIVQLLVAAGADVTLADQRDNTALTLAEKSNLSKTRKKELTKLLESAAE